MDNKERYKQLKKENDDRVASLVDSYHFIAHTYVLKARGYAEASLDTEARIKDVIDELYDFCDKGMLAPMAIPNTTEYINSKMTVLAKKKNTGEKAKSIIFSVIFFTFLGAVVIFGLVLRGFNYLDEPKNIEVTPIGGSLQVSWDKIDQATQGYTVYYIDENGEQSELFTVDQPADDKTRVSTIINLDPTKEQTIYVYANDITTTDAGEIIYLYKASKHVEYKYIPKE